MAAVLAVLLFILKVIGVLLAIVLALLVIALLIPVSLWVDYKDEALTLQVGALGLRYTVFPKKKTDDAPKADKQESSAEKPAEAVQSEKERVTTASVAAQEKQTVTESAAKEKRTENKCENTVPTAPKKSVQKVPGNKKIKAEQAASEQKPEQAAAEQVTDKSAALKLTFQQVVTAVRGVGAFGKAILCGIKVRHIHIYLPIIGDDAADTAIRYGKMQAWLYTGLGFLNRAMWLEFDECYLDADFMQEKQKKERFSCQISAQLIIMVIAVVRFIWLLWKANILDVLLEQFSGNNNV